MNISSAARRLLSSPVIGRERALTAAEQLSATAYLMSSLEILAAERDRQKGGLNNWDLARDNYTWAPPKVREALDFLARPDVTRWIHMARALASASLLVPGTSRHHRAAANGFLALTSVAVYPRHHYGTDGSDQLSFLVQSAAMVARIGGRQPALVDSCLWYVALQATLSYATSGYVKIASPVWRSGEALPGIMRTETYGDGKVYDLMRRYPKASRKLAHAVLAMECAFPAVFLANGRLTPAMLAGLGSFHVVNARVMGLSRFVWAFLATYPAILYVTQSRDSTRHGGGSR
ncbi:hypothetical protein [Streptomyces winkii]|uniref:hypothetical protein n=1 Tax=Streptomyces winkii TaxID=3051178 RepID=UPI0028D14680|nr:hypothetical protein [Streptomyces sp. DSM 40971]